MDGRRRGDREVPPDTEPGVRPGSSAGGALTWPYGLAGALSCVRWFPASTCEFPWTCARVVHWGGLPGAGASTWTCDQVSARSRGGWSRGLCLVCSSAGVRVAGWGGHGRASLWPLSVDGLLLLATVGLLKPDGAHKRRARGSVWSAFLLGIAVSLAANVAAAPALEWKPVLVAGWPPVALLLSLELLVHRPDDVQVKQSGRWGQAKSERLHDDDDPLLPRARMVDARHRELHQRHVSAETLRKELRIGARRSRQLAALVRRSRGGRDETEAFRNRVNQPQGRRSD